MSKTAFVYPQLSSVLKLFKQIGMFGKIISNIVSYVRFSYGNVKSTLRAKERKLFS